MTTAYRAYLLVFDGLLPATDNTELFLRFSDDDGSTYEADASDYAWSHNSASEGSTNTPVGDADDSEISIGSAWGDQAAEAGAGQITIHNPAGTGLTQVWWQVSRQSQAPAFVAQSGAGQMQAAGATTAFRMLFSSGNIAAMNYTLYGMGAV
jgi:hypothetical protein